MAAGKSGSFELTGTYGITVKVFWSETYTMDSNQSVVSIDKVQVKSSKYNNVTYYLNGNISVDGSKVITFVVTSGTHNADLIRGLNTYVDVVAAGNYKKPPWTTGNITHNNDGSKSVSITLDIYGATKNGGQGDGWKVVGSKTVELTTIPRASSITYASNVTLGNACSIKWIPLSAAFYYKMGFQIGNWKYSTEVVHPNKTTEYTYTGLTIPLEVASQIPNDPSGTMYVYLHTFSDSAGTNQIGNTASATFKVTVPDNQNTKPKVNMTLTPVHSLPSKFSGLYIQGKSKVKGTLTTEGKFGASVGSPSMAVGTKSYGASEAYTSDYLNTYGKISVTGSAKDSRGFTGENPQEIEVIAYQAPKLESVSAVRCDKYGNESESGTFVKIYAKRTCTPVNGQNICKVQFCYSQDGVSYTDWSTLSQSTKDTEEVFTDALLGTLSAQASYVLQIRVVDEIGNPVDSFITISTEKVYWHRDGARNALGLGKYNEKDNAIDSAWDFHMNGKKVTGLPTPTGSTDAVPLGLLKDYVVEQGTGGIWAYRKWNSGLAELWSSLSATHQNGYVLASAEVTYPITLTSAVCGIGSLNSYGGNAATALPWNVKLAYSKTACRMWVHSSDGGFAADTTVYGSAYIVGRWK